MATTATNRRQLWVGNKSRKPLVKSLAQAQTCQAGSDHSEHENPDVYAVNKQNTIKLVSRLTSAEPIKYLM